jgi:4-amino-4-deoxy-L-arabinose transferase-like glycosyltransferase
VRRITATRFLLGIALLVGTINYALAIDDELPKKDGAENYCAAANLYVVGTFSDDCDYRSGIPRAAPQPSMKREPGTPALVALTFALLNGDQDVRACVATSPDWCKALRIHQRMLLAVPFVALILLVYIVCYDITARGALSAIAALCAAFGTGLVESSMSFLSETAAAVLLLLVAWMLCRITNHRHVMISGVVCGVALGLLSLTKAVYFYFLPVLGLLALFALAFRARRGAALSTLTAVLIAALISGLWIYRNHERLGTNAIAGRDNRVMGIRAAFTTISWSQYWTGYLAFTPMVGPRLIEILGIGSENFAVFDRKRPESLEVGGQTRKVLGGKITRQRSLSTLVENWPMELALVPLTIYRSAFLPVGFYSHRGANEPLPMRIISSFSLAIATVIALSMLPALLLNVVVDLWRLNVARLAFHLPAVYSVGIHSVMTHYIPRYNLPLFGIFAVELCIAAAFLWSFLPGSDAKAAFSQESTSRL